MTLQWTEDLAVGHPEIDRQHRELITRFNNFLDACHQRKGKESLLELLGFLDSYVDEHFRQEERLMEQHAYPELPAHRAQHEEFRRRLALLQDELAPSGPTISVLIHTNKTLLYWLTTHIKQVDVRFGRFLQQRSAV